MKQFRYIKVRDKDLDSVQSNIQRVLVPILKTSLIDGTQITFTTTTGTNRIPHTLDRIPLGVMIVDKDANESFYRTDWDSKTITIEATGPATFSAWVY